MMKLIARITLFLILVYISPFIMLFMILEFLERQLDANATWELSMGRHYLLTLKQLILNKPPVGVGEDKV